MGISERIAKPPAGETQTRPWVYGSAGGAYIEPTRKITPAPKPTPQVKGTTTTTRTSPTSGLIPTGSTPTPTQETYSPPSGPSQKEIDTQRLYEERMRSGINAAYSPIFTELDRQIGLLPTQRAEFEQNIANLAGTQATGVEQQRLAGEQKMAAATEAEKAQAAGSLRDLEQDLRNQIRAWAVYLGGKGAGESSAPGMVSEIVTKGGLKARSGILAARNKALNDIQLKVQDINNLASQEVNKIDQWKSTNLASISQWATNRLNELNTAKANASAEQQNTINNLIQETHTQYLTRLQQLQDSYNNYNAQVSLWQQQRTADMQDYATKLQLASQYTSTAPAEYKYQKDVFGNLYAIPKGSTQATPVSGMMSLVSPTAGIEGMTEEEKKNLLTLTLSNMLGVNQ
jgi:hypothetical protein